MRHFQRLSALEFPEQEPRFNPWIPRKGRDFTSLCIHTSGLSVEGTEGIICQIRYILQQSVFAKIYRPLPAGPEELRLSRAADPSGRLHRRRGERLERAFTHMYETGRLRRVYLHGRSNILKRVLIHTAGSCVVQRCAAESPGSRLTAHQYRTFRYLRFDSFPLIFALISAVTSTTV